MNTNAPTFRFSPKIEIDLEAKGRSYRVAVVGPDYLIVDPPTTLPPTQAMLVVTVDGREVRRRVSLPAGVNPDAQRQPMTVLETYASIEPAQAS